MRVQGIFKRPIHTLVAIVLPILLMSTFLPQSTFASQIETESFTIEAGQIQGVMLPPKIVFVDTDSAHPRPAVEFRYQEATITGMILYKQLETGNGPMLVKIQASEPIHVTNLAVTATSFSFTGACLDFSNPSQALVMKNVTMQATSMTSDTMSSNGLTLATQKGTLPAQNQAVPAFLQGIMNENSFSAEKQKASEIEAAKSLLMCPASSQGDTSTSSNKKLGGLPVVPSPGSLVKQVTGADPTQITKLVPTPSGLLSKTDPILTTVKKQVSAIDPSDLNKTVGQVVKTVTDTSSVTKTVGKVVKTVTDPSTVTKTVGQVTTDTSKTVTKTADQLKLEKELSQLQDDFVASQKRSDYLTGQIDKLGQTIKDDQTTLNDISNVLSNPFNILKVGDELIALGQLNTQLSDAKSQMGQLKDQESKEQQVYLDIEKRVQDLGSAINTDDLKTSLDKNQTQLASLTNQLSTLTNGVQSLLNQFS